MNQAIAAPVFEWPIRVYWEDTDAGGIVFYANYLRFFERARTEWLRSLGLGQLQLCDEHHGMFVVSQVGLQYLRPARLDDSLVATVCLTQGGKASLTVAQQVWRLGGDGTRTLLCEGHVRAGWVHHQTLKPQRIPAAVLHRVGAAPDAEPLFTSTHPTLP